MRQGTPGLSFGRPEAKLGWCAQPTAAVQLDAVRVPAGQRLGAEGDGFRIAMAARAPLLPRLAVPAGLPARAHSRASSFTSLQESLDAGMRTRFRRVAYHRLLLLSLQRGKACQRAETTPSAICIAYPTAMVAKTWMRHQRG